MHTSQHKANLMGSRYCMNAAALEFVEASKLPPEMKPLVKGQ